MEFKKLNYIRSAYLLRSKGVKFGKNPYIQGNPIITNKGTFKIGDRFSMANIQFKTELTCSEGAELIMGNDVFVNQGSNIYAAESVNIGNNVLIADSVIMHDTNFHLIDADGVIVKPIEIGNNVWIGNRSIILPGVTIGKNSVIGAGSVVTKSIPSDYLAAGNPAELKKKLNVKHNRT